MVPSDGVDEEKRATLRRFAALGASIPLLGSAASAAEDDSEVRDALVGYVALTPGAHYSKVRDDLHLGNGEAQHHLRLLEERGVVEAYSDGDYRRYVLSGRFDAFERRALGYLRRETPRGMLVELLRDPSVTASELAERLEVSRPTVSNHSGDLEEAGLLVRGDGYAVERPETVLTLLVRHADSFGERTATLADEADELISYDPT